LREEVAFALDLSPLNPNLMRLSWPGRTDRVYEILGASAPDRPLNTLGAIPGTYPETEYLVPINVFTKRFFQVRTVP
jgi:hypothetical protein